MWRSYIIWSKWKAKDSILASFFPDFYGDMEFYGKKTAESLSSHHVKSTKGLNTSCVHGTVMLFGGNGDWRCLSP
jgi:hypothetical protein